MSHVEDNVPAVSRSIAVTTSYSEGVQKCTKIKHIASLVQRVLRGGKSNLRLTQYQGVHNLTGLPSTLLVFWAVAQPYTLGFSKRQCLS